ncbi:hypothetical protein F5Y15DRAFT_377490 [Xylariaceae sp. FL0016]|nr:hypothetical protein F5Y15DRAFT_377490 [Xylariaceae sp. FL0016]
MSEQNSAPADSPAANKQSAPKDRNCPYCGQAFTSSSLGRHLDLYIKEKNPKPPDGLHDVDAIRKMRGTITRRQPRGSLARRDVSSPSTPQPSGSKRGSPGPESAVRPSGIPEDGHFAVDQQAPRNLFQPTWEATGVMNDIPASNGEAKSTPAWNEPSPQDSSNLAAQRPGIQRAPSRVAQKTQLDARQKLADAMDTARAAELALRELLSSFRAAKQHIDMNSLPFDFDPLSLDFPALTLQCLQAPPTLFSSTPHPTSTSWSIQPPAQKQYEALQMYFQEEFRRWKVSCAMATTAISEDLTYPPSNSHFPRDVHEGVKKAERTAASLEKQVNEHLQSTYQVWEQLTPQRRSELWGLELARGVGRRQKDLEKLKESQYTIKQENANLKTQIEQLNRLQQPREFRIVPPATIPIAEKLLSYCLDLGASGFQTLGFDNEDRHVDLATVVSRAIERWKTVIVSSRGGGMNSQKSLDQVTPTTTTPTSATTPVSAPSTQLQSGAQQQPRQRPLPSGKSAAPNDARGAPVAPVAPAAPPVPSMSKESSTSEENSDQDADAEMEDDDSFTQVNPVVAKPPAHQQLDVPRTRGHNPRMPSNTEARYMGNGIGGNRNLNMRQSMPNMNTQTAMQGRVPAQHGHIANNDYGTVVPGVGGGEPMYMD